MTFAVGGLAGWRSWIGPAGASGCVAAAAAGLAGRVGGLFGYHALYFVALRLAPPAEAGLLNYLWPLLIVLLFVAAPRRAAGAPITSSARCLGLVGTVLLLGGNAQRFARRHIPGLCRRVRRGFRVGRLFGDVAQAQVGADRRGGRLLPGHRAAGDAGSSDGRGHGVARNRDAMAGGRSAWHRPGRRRVLHLGYRNEARRYPRAGRGVLRDAAAFDRDF